MNDDTGKARIDLSDSNMAGCGYPVSADYSTIKLFVNCHHHSQVLSFVRQAQTTSFGFLCTQQRNLDTALASHRTNTECLLNGC